MYIECSVKSQNDDCDGRERESKGVLANVSTPKSHHIDGCSLVVNYLVECVQLSTTVLLINLSKRTHEES